MASTRSLAGGADGVGGAGGEGSGCGAAGSCGGGWGCLAICRVTLASACSARAWPVAFAVRENRRVRAPVRPGLGIGEEGARRFAVARGGGWERGGVGER